MREVPLTRGYIALVDDEDYERVSAYKWNSKVHGNTVYAQRTIWVPETKSKRTVRMNRFIAVLEFGDPRVIDHHDGNGLNNQKLNLRVCSDNTDNIRAQRVRSTPNKSSQYKGVSYEKKTKKSGRKRWAAYIGCGGRKRIGRFLTEVEAAKAYNAAAIEMYGEFATLNNIAA